MKQRNTTVDVLRGIAMMLVVLGHTMTGSTVKSEDSFLFNVVWSLQMPLFILISGYVTRYGKAITTFRDLRQFIYRRTESYIIPWCIWTLVIRGIIFGETSFLNLKWLLYHMDTGYWFLITIWTINLVFGCTCYFANKMVPNASQFVNSVVTGGFYFLGMLFLVGIAYIAGLSFFAIKLTLYYMPFFFAGVLYGRIQEVFAKKKRFVVIQNIFTAAALVIWLYVLMNVNLYRLEDGGMGIIIRAGTSLLGCCAVAAITAKLRNGRTGAGRFLYWCGVHSLEIYTIHYLLLNLIKVTPVPQFQTYKGIALTGMNYLLTMALVTLCVYGVNRNRVVKMILTGKGIQPI